MKKKKGSLFKDLLPYVVIPIITLIVNILFSETQNNVGIGITLIGTLIVLFVLIILSISANWLIRTVVKDGIESVLLSKTEDVAIEAISRFEEKRKLSEQISEKLYSLNQLLEFEELRCINGANITKVQIITGSFAYDSPEEFGLNERFMDVVKENVANGISYKYYITDTQANIRYINNLNRMTKNSISFAVLSDEFFFLSGNFDFTVYTTEDAKGHESIIGFMPLPKMLVMSQNSSVCLYHTEVPSELLEKILARLPQTN